MPKAYSYVRFSTPDQAKGDSYRRQMQAAERYCQANGLELAQGKEYLFFDRGRSAYKGDHLDDTGELARFYALVKDGSIECGSVLLVESLDRLSRERVRDALPRFLDLLSAGVEVVTLIDGRRYDAQYDELDLIVSIIAMSRAHNESATKSARVSATWSNKQAEARTSLKPLGSACPYWLKLVDDAQGRRYEPIPERVVAVQRIYQLCQAGYGQRTIARMLNEEGIPIFGSEKRNRSGAWGSSSVIKILENRALVGEYQPTHLVDGIRVPNGDPVQGFFPVIITPDEFYAAKAVREQRKTSKATRATATFNLWQGLARCAECKGAMHLLNKGNPPKGGKYLRCYNAARGVCKGTKQVPLPRSEEVFRELLAKVDSLSLVQTSAASIQKALAALKGREAEVSERLAELSAQLLSLGTKLPATLVQVVGTLETELAENRAQQEALQVDLQREQIVDKEDFFARLDLMSYEGRYRANALFKTLGLLIFIKNISGKFVYLLVSKAGNQIGVYDLGDNLLWLPGKATEQVAQAQKDTKLDSYLRLIPMGTDPQIDVLKRLRGQG